MRLYAEYQNGERKATVTKINEHWHHHFDNWRVVFMQNGNPIQASSCKTEADAQKMAEDYVNANASHGPTLLNEHISNG